ncbi:MAG: hypothetical protein JO273_08195, partial [Methylobacteriaceae bacterium]|nr:hypothetical protein [Methylobacteriaceae bacterium]
MNKALSRSFPTDEKEGRSVLSWLAAGVSEILSVVMIFEFAMLMARPADHGSQATELQKIEQLTALGASIAKIEGKRIAAQAESAGRAALVTAISAWNDTANMGSDAEAHVTPPRADEAQPTVGQLGEIEKEVAEASANRDRIKGEAEKAAKDYAGLQAKLQEETDEVAERSGELAGLDDRLQKARAELGEAAKGSKQLAENRDNLKLLGDQLGEIEKEVAEASANRDRIKGEAEKAAKDYAGLQAKLQEGTDQAAQRSRELAGLDDRLQKARTELGEASQGSKQLAEVQAKLQEE